MASKKNLPWYQQEPYLNHPPSMVANFNRPDFVILQQKDEYDRKWTSEDLPILLSIVRERKFKYTDTQFNALKALGEITSGWKKEYVQQLITIFNRDEEDNELLFDTVHFLLNKIGVPAIRSLVEYTNDMTRPDYGVGLATESIEAIAKKTKIPQDLREYLITEFMARLAKNKKSTEYKSLNSHCVNLLVALRATESLDLIRECFLADSIENDLVHQYGTILQMFNMEIPQDDALVSKCHHCGLPQEICQDNTEKLRLEKFQEAKLKNDLIGQYTFSEDYPEPHLTVKIAKMYLSMNRFNDAKSYLVLANKKEVDLWEQCNKTVTPAALPKREYRVKSVTTMKNNVKKEYDTCFKKKKKKEWGTIKNQSVVISNEYIAWVHENALHYMNLQDNSKKSIALPQLAISSICIHGNVVATGGEDDYKVNLYDLNRGELIESYEGLRSSVGVVTFNDKYIVATGHSQQLLWKRNFDGSSIRLMGMKPTLCTVTASMSDSTVMLGTPKVVREYDLDTGNYLGAFAGDFTQGLDLKISPVQFNDNFVAVGMENELAVFHRGNHHRVFSIPLDTTRMSLHEDVIAFASGDLLQIWDIPTRTPLYTFNQLSFQVEDIRLRVDKEAKILELAMVLCTGEYSCVTWNIELQKVSEECFKCKKQEAKLKMCGRCGRASYCSADCQKADWSDHKAFCVNK